MTTWTMDLRHSLRGFLRSPGFTLIALLSLALGIGANTAIFTLMDRVVLQSLPVKNPSELVNLRDPGPRSGFILSNYDSDHAYSYPRYRDFRDRAPGFAGVCAWYEVPASFSRGAQTEYLKAELVSGNYFDVLGVRAILGRSLTPRDEGAPGASPVAVLSYSFWMKEFAGDPQVLNQRVMVNAQPMTIVGVATPGFNGLTVGNAPAMFVPLTMTAQMMPGQVDPEQRRSMWLTITARLKPGESAKAAETALDAFTRPILQEEVKEMPSISANSRQRFLNRHIQLEPGGHGISYLRDSFAQPLALLMGLVGLVLLIACANVANLMLARAAGRQKEIAIRIALGAGRARIIRQVLIESAALAVAGGALGLLLASITGDILLRLLPFSGVTDAISTAPDTRVLLFTGLVAAASGILFGLAPALQTAAASIADTLKAQASNVSVGIGQVRFRKGLVAAQVGLSTLLLIGAGLFVRSVQNLKSIDPGFRTSRLISFAIDPSLNRYSGQRTVALYNRLLDQIAGIPGVRAVSASHDGLLAGSDWKTSIVVPGREKKETDVTPNSDPIGPGYFALLGVPLISGREFTAGDVANAPPVAVVNQAFVNMYFDGRNPIGEHIAFQTAQKQLIEITGVVKDIKYQSLTDQTPATVFTPFAQRPPSDGMTFFVRSAQDPESIVANLRQAVRQADPDLPMYDIKTMEQQIDESVFTQRIISQLSVVFGGLATLLAAIGLYGVMAYMVTRRTREIGIRMALGAGRADVLKLVLTEVSVLVAIGVGVALPLAFPLTKLAQAQLYGVGAHDPLVMAGSVVMLMLVAALAGFVPARRAAGIDPNVALRSE